MIVNGKYRLETRRNKRNKENQWITQQKAKEIM